jgi:hypothetical protein
LTKNYQKLPPPLPPRRAVLAVPEVLAGLGLHYYKNKNYKNKNYKNKNNENKKLWVIQKIFLFAKRKN